jgi:hypothetical protein
VETGARDFPSSQEAQRAEIPAESRGSYGFLRKMKEDFEMKVLLANEMLEVYMKTNGTVVTPTTQFCYGAAYSIGAGRVDPPYHFDHHEVTLDGRCRAPCNDPKIPVIGKDDKVIITRMDADTFVGLLRMGGISLPEVDFQYMERMDLKGKSICTDRNDPTLQYMLGVERLAAEIGIPQVEHHPVDITPYVEKMMEKSPEEIIALGREIAMEKERRKADERFGNVTLWYIGFHEPSSPARTYRDGVDVAVVLLREYGQIVISSNPKTNLNFEEREICGIKFTGSAHSSGSSRKLQYAAADARKVAREIFQDLEKYVIVPPARKRSSSDD